jgi:hypothetical protein
LENVNVPIVRLPPRLTVVAPVMVVPNVARSPVPSGQAVLGVQLVISAQLKVPVVLFHV